jgi:hypothetical protein
MYVESVSRQLFDCYRFSARLFDGTLACHDLAISAVDCG